MKLNECNAHQKKAYANIYHACNWLVGGLENVLLDYRPEDPEYKSAQAKLADHEGLVNTLYDMATTEIYADGACYFGGNTSSFLRDIRFCGKEWLMERCDKRIKKCGY